MPKEIWIVMIACIIGAIYLWNLRRKDRYEKEPIRNLILATVLGGLISTLYGIVIFHFVGIDKAFFDTFLTLAVIEEGAKFLAFYLLYLFIKKEFDEIVDGIIYIAAVALGFSVVENIFHCLIAESHLILLLLRSVLSTLSHIVFSSFIGLAFYIHVRIHKNYLGLFFAFFIASLSHGLYDTIAFDVFINYITMILCILVLYLSSKALKSTLSLSRFKSKLASDALKTTRYTSFSNCDHCHIKVKNNLLKLWKIKAVVCQECGRLIISSGSIQKLYEYYRPLSGVDLNVETYKGESISHLGPEKRIIYNHNMERLNGSAKDIDDWLSKNNIIDQRKLINNKNYGFIFHILGLKYLIDIGPKDWFEMKK